MSRKDGLSYNYGSIRMFLVAAGGPGAIRLISLDVFPSVVLGGAGVRTRYNETVLPPHCWDLFLSDRRRRTMGIGN